jgi:hypothetical protein
LVEIPLNAVGGAFEVPVEINGAITLNFIVDSGAADVTIPADVVSTLIRTGTIKPSDFVGTQGRARKDSSEAPSGTRGSRLPPNMPKKIDVRFWHKADITAVLSDVRFWGNSGHRDFRARCLLLTQSDC